MLWGIDNGLFFVVAALSIKITSKFRFIGQLIAIFVLYKLESWYKLVMVRLEIDSR